MHGVYISWWDGKSSNSQRSWLNHVGITAFESYPTASRPETDDTLEVLSGSNRELGVLLIQPPGRLAAVLVCDMNDMKPEVFK